MKRASVIVFVTLLALMAVGPFGPATASAAPRVAPKVVLVVGPAGAATESYRRLANEAAVVAAKYTPNVVKVYSPDATWPAVKQALQGASVVVYLGHGNGWPSRYRNELTPSTQNGMGLNPNAGAGDTHQYFGEDRVGSEIKLAKHAIVIFSHLCYASGNSEPGLPEGSLEDGQQRVDNYAAGFVRAGASAVIAEAYMGPAYYVGAILKGKGTVDKIWRSAPTFHNNLLRFASLRSKGYTAQMDTDRETSGFHRSIVLRPGLTAANVLGNAARIPSGGQLPPIEPTLTGLGIDFEAPDLAAPPTASAKTNLVFTLTAADPSVVPNNLMVGVRWDSLEGTTAVRTPDASPSPPPSAAASSPVTAPPAVAPDPIDLVVPEVIGDVVAPVAATRTGNQVSVPVRVPSTPGLYRLVGTIHGGDGVAFDAATQALMPALIVRVTGPLTAVYDAPETAFVTAGETFQLPASVTNLSAAAWGSPAIKARLGAESAPAHRATFVARWVDMTGRSGSPAAEGTAVLPAGLAPGARGEAVFRLTAPAAPGEYLILLDVLVPRTGSLALEGVSPAIIRVTVSGAAATAAP
jgi:hypothetical protein